MIVLHKAVKSKCESKANLNHVLICVAKSSELTLGEWGGQFVFRDYLLMTF